MPWGRTILFMIPKPLSEVTKDYLEALEALATNQVHQGRTLEYKRDVKLASEEDKRETARRA